MLDRRKAKHIVLGDGFPMLAKNKKMSVHALLIDGWLGDDTSNVRSK